MLLAEANKIAIQRIKISKSTRVKITFRTRVLFISVLARLIMSSILKYYRGSEFI